MDEFKIKREYTGAQINAAGVGQFVKLTNIDESHNNFSYKTGLNVDTVDFHPYEECTRGGMYFCHINDAFRWLDYASRNMIFFRNVTLPDDARVYVEENKLKTDKFILSDRAEIKYSAEIFNQLIKSGHLGEGKVHFSFDKSFYTEDVWKMIMENDDRIWISRIPEYLLTSELFALILKMKKKWIPSLISLHEMAYFPQTVLDEKALDALIDCGLKYVHLPDYMKTCTTLRAFLRARNFKEASYFPKELFDESTLSHIRLTRATRSILDFKIPPVPSIKKH